MKTYNLAYNGETFKVTPVIWHGEIYHDYWMCVKSGRVFSTKRYSTIELAPATSEASNASMYPKVVIYNGIKRKTVKVHRLVGHTLIPMTRKPKNMSESCWNIVKSNHELLSYIYNESMELNHIDENKCNYHPSNLEWVSRSENRNAYWNQR